MIIKMPPYLQPGDTIGITCPAGYMAYEKAAECIRVLQEEWGYQVKIGKTLGSQSATYFSGTEKERLSEFQEMLDDDAIKTVLCGRGGYGMAQIIDGIDFSKFKKNPKWVIGFSDITLFHTHLYSNFHIASLHAPMAAAFNDEQYKNKYVKSLKDALEGKWAKYIAEGHEYNILGEAIAELVGGNLSLIIAGLGTKSELKTKGRILFLEDIGEQKYSIDRMMIQLKRAGKLDKLAGLIVGRFTDVADTERPFGMEVYDIIRNVVKEYKYPICYHFPISHDKENYAIKIGVGYKLKVTKKRVVLEE